MPIDYSDIKKPIYNPFNPNQFNNVLNSIQPFHNKLISRYFAKKWTELLYLCDQDFIGKDLDYPFENYSLMGALDETVKISVTFNIEKTLRILFQQNASQTIFDLSLFGEFHQYSQRTPITFKYEPGSSFINMPIIILHSEVAYERTFVIDGNHRVSFAKDHGFKHLSGFVIDDNFLIDNNLFADIWSLNYFLFSIDLNTLLEQKKNTKNIFLFSLFHEYSFFKKNTFLSTFLKDV